MSQWRSAVVDVEGTGSHYRIYCAVSANLDVNALLAFGIQTSNATRKRTSRSVAA
jgi:hypothetical protein